MSKIGDKMMSTLSKPVMGFGSLNSFLLVSNTYVAEALQDLGPHGQGSMSLGTSYFVPSLRALSLSMVGATLFHFFPTFLSHLFLVLWRLLFSLVVKSHSFCYVFCHLVCCFFEQQQSSWH